MEARLRRFNFWISAAIDEIAGRGLAPSMSWRSLMGVALRFLQHALTWANRMGCAARKGLCMRLMNWLRADMRRAA